VLCGRDPRLHGEGDNDTYEAERTTYSGRERAYQQARSGAAAQVRQAMVKEGINEADYARALAYAHKTRWDVIKEVARTNIGTDPGMAAAASALRKAIKRGDVR
jgi:hypothetical protein